MFVREFFKVRLALLNTNRVRVEREGLYVVLLMKEGKASVFAKCFLLEAFELENVIKVLIGKPKMESKNSLEELSIHKFLLHCASATFLVGSVH
uniref:FBD domain-containing protein n=1 Tax=Syphacia muris TaxID=451379 RepID=A0A0N5AJR2_9BILA